MHSMNYNAMPSVGEKNASKVQSDILIRSDYFLNKIYDFIIQLNASIATKNTHVHKPDHPIRVWFITVISYNFPPLAANRFRIKRQY